MSNEKNEVGMVAPLPNQNESLTTMPTQSAGVMNVFSDAQSFEMALRMADCLSKSTVVPKEYQGNNGNCLIAIEMAARINTSPLMVMQNLYIVNGKPAWSSQWIISMINSSHRYKTELQYEITNLQEDGGLGCRAFAEDWSGHVVYGPKVTMKMANDEGWVNKNGSKWKTMPEVMIQYRAASFFGRMNCPDMIMGIYSKDEVMEMDEVDSGYGLTIDENGEIVDTDIVKDEPITQAQRQELFKVAKEEVGEDANAVLKELLNQEGYDSTSGITTSVMEKILDKVRVIGEERRAESSSQSE